MPVESVGMCTMEKQQCAATSSPLVPYLFLNVPGDPLSCVSCSMCSSGSRSWRGELVLFSAKRPLVTSSVAVTPECVISLSELSDLLLDEALSSPVLELSPSLLVFWSSHVSWWTGLSPLLSVLSWASLAVGNKIHRPTLSLFQHKNQQPSLLLCLLSAKAHVVSILEMLYMQKGRDSPLSKSSSFWDLSETSSLVFPDSSRDTSVSWRTFSSTVEPAESNSAFSPPSAVDDLHTKESSCAWQEVSGHLSSGVSWVASWCTGCSAVLSTFSWAGPAVGIRVHKLS